LFKLNVNAGVVVAVPTLTPKSGDNPVLDTLVTVPIAVPLISDFPVPLVTRLMFWFAAAVTVTPAPELIAGVVTWFVATTVLK
jgi:hypothetical protein